MRVLFVDIDTLRPDHLGCYGYTRHTSPCIDVIAEEVTPIATKWLSENADKDNWFLHYHIWDPHTPYRAPEAFGNPFAEEPLPDDWIDETLFAEHRNHIGPHGAREIGMWNDHINAKYPRYPGKLESLGDVKNFIDQYDCGIRYADDNLAQLIHILKEKGVYEETAIIVTSDHGENMGELGIYGEHATADPPCCHIPMIIKWPNMAKGVTNDTLRVNLDLAPTMAELLGVKPYAKWDGKSYAKVLKGEDDGGYEAVIVNQCAHVCQRSARFGDYIYIRTVHGGYHLFEDEMLFNLKEDPHQTQNLAKELPDIVAKGAKYILDWEYDMMKSSDYDVDPMWTVMREGGPEHARGAFDNYIKRLMATEREFGVALLKEKYNFNQN